MFSWSPFQIRSIAAAINDVCEFWSLGLISIGRADGFGRAGVFQHLVADAVRHCLPGIEEPVAFAVFPNAFGRLAGAAGHHVDQSLLGLEDLLGLDLDIRRLAVNTAER